MSYYPEAVSLAIQPASELWDADSICVFARLAASFDAAAKLDAAHAGSAQSVTSE